MTKELAIQILRGEVLGTNEQTHEAVFMAIKALKNEQKNGKWTKVFYCDDSYNFRCSACGNISTISTKYCGNCGAMMEICRE